MAAPAETQTEEIDFMRCENCDYMTERITNVENNH